VAIVEQRQKILFLPLVRSFFNPVLGQRAKERAVKAAKRLELEAIFPEDGKYTAGSICSDADVREYYNGVWKKELANIKALIIIGGNFMEERGFQDTLRLLPDDVPAFLIFQNDNPSKMDFENRGDGFCGSLSIHRNAAMIGRGVLASRGIDMEQEDILLDTLNEYVRIIDGIESLRNMRVAMVGVNPVEFSTTFTNQMELFRLGFSIHTYELLDLWGAAILADKQERYPEQMKEIFPGLKPTNPITNSDPRVAESREKWGSLLASTRVPQDRVDLMIRCFLWIKDIFERDAIDTGGIHCWTTFEQYFQITPCTFSALANSILGKPLVCETDICHAIMCGLGWAITGEPGVILDLNNPGWDPRVVSLFHCSQTPPEWIKGTGEVVEQIIIEGDANVGKGNAFGAVGGEFEPAAFTGLSAATSSTGFEVTVFQGQILRESPDSFGSTGWAFIPNNQDVLDEIHKRGIHHCVIIKGHLGAEAARALEFRGANVVDLSVPVPSLEAIEKELGPVPAGGRGVCPIHSR
jgi:L-fucose isomerase-like protein